MSARNTAATRRCLQCGCPAATGPDRVVFGELTVYPGSGLTDFREHPELDRELGDRWVLPPDVAPRAARRGRRSTPVRGRG